MKDTPAPTIGAQRLAPRRNTGNNELILHQKYREQPKEQFNEMLRKGKIVEDFT